MVSFRAKRRGRPRTTPTPFSSLLQRRRRGPHDSRRRRRGSRRGKLHDRFRRSSRARTVGRNPRLTRRAPDPRRRPQKLLGLLRPSDGPSTPRNGEGSARRRTQSRSVDRPRSRGRARVGADDRTSYRAAHAVARPALGLGGSLRQRLHGREVACSPRVAHHRVARARPRVGNRGQDAPTAWPFSPGPRNRPTPRSLDRTSADNW